MPCYVPNFPTQKGRPRVMDIYPWWYVEWNNWCPAAALFVQSHGCIFYYCTCPTYLSTSVWWMWMPAHLTVIVCGPSQSFGSCTAQSNRGGLEAINVPTMYLCIPGLKCTHIKDGVFLIDANQIKKQVQAKIYGSRLCTYFTLLYEATSQGPIPLPQNWACEFSIRIQYE